MDMVRFTEFTVGAFWKSDYGDPKKPDEFKVLYSYSPLHNIKPGTKYPATLVTTADTTTASSLPTALATRLRFRPAKAAMPLC